jgi:hypothetical protein
MTAIVAGTRQAHARHSRTWGPLGLLLSMAPPVALLVAGIVVEGWGAISPNGAVLAIAWAYGTALGGLSANVWTALAWGAVLWVLALLMLSTIGSVHPAIRAGRQDDPGPAATDFGPMTPLGILVSHLVWGAVLGLGYAAWPLG